MPLNRQTLSQPARIALQTLSTLLSIKFVPMSRPSSIFTPSMRQQCAVSRAGLFHLHRLEENGREVKENRGFCYSPTHSFHGTLCSLQDGSFFFNKVATHEWEGVSDDPGEGERIGKAVLSIPRCNILLMPNHGFCTFATSVKEAFIQAFYFEKACETQVLALGTGKKLLVPPADIMKKSERQNYSDVFRPGECEWDAVCDLIERKYGVGR
jgi:hypothetical protein